MTKQYPSDWDVALERANNTSPFFASAVVQVLDTAWTVHAYLKHHDLPCDGETIALLTAQITAREDSLKERAGY